MASRLRRTLSAALVTAAIALPVSGAARPSAVPAPPPSVSAAIGPATSAALAERYADTRADILAAERMAAGHGDRERAAALRALAEPGRQLLAFDGRDGGRSIEVFGDLARADRIAVLVPGSGTSLDAYERLRSGSAALQQRLGDRSAVVAWLGYRTPSMVSAEILNADLAHRVAPELQRFIAQLEGSRPGARISLLCHSYGSVVCARAVSGLDVSDLVLFGSPGVGYDNVGALHTHATVWAGRGAGDRIGDVPHIRLQLPFTTVGFGPDPVSPTFGARLFAAGDGGHSDYLKPGSTALQNIARIVSGQSPAIQTSAMEVGHA